DDVRVVRVEACGLVVRADRFWIPPLAVQGVRGRDLTRHVATAAAENDGQPESAEGAQATVWHTLNQWYQGGARHERHQRAGWWASKDACRTGKTPAAWTTQPSVLGL